MSNGTQIFKVLDGLNGKIADVTPQPQPITEDMIRFPRDHKGRITVDYDKTVNFQEAGQLTTTSFPDLLRTGLQFDAWSTYNQTPITYPQFVRMVDSNKPAEEYLFDSPVGLPPIVAEGAPYPEATTDLAGGKEIKNRKRGEIISVTMEMRMFDKVGKVREIGQNLGESFRLVEEYDVMDVVTTTGNYTKAGNTGDNDETATGNGANQQTLTFSPTALIAAFNILRTMKDRKTGMYKNVMPDTLIITPKLWWAARQLIQSPEVMRTAYGTAGGAAQEIYGTGTKNSFFDTISTIIVSPIFGNGYQWSLMQRNKAVVFQRVLPFELLSEPSNAGANFERDVLRYRGSSFYGVGMRDDSYSFFSNSTTAPAVN